MNPLVESPLNLKVPPTATFTSTPEIAPFFFTSTVPPLLTRIFCSPLAAVMAPPLVAEMLPLTRIPSVLKVPEAVPLTINLESLEISMDPLTVTRPVVPEDSDIADLSYMKDLSLVLYRINFTDEDLKKDILKYKFFLDKYLNSLSDDDVIDPNLANSLKALAALCNVYIESENKVSESKQFGEEVPDFVTQTLRETLEKIKVQLQKNIEEITAFSSPKT